MDQYALWVYGYICKSIVLGIYVQFFYEEIIFSLFEHWLLKNVYFCSVGGKKTTSKREQRKFICFTE